MTALSQIPAGGRVTALMLQNVAPLVAYKSGDQSIVSSSTYQNDSQLYVPLLANAAYVFELFMIYEGGTQGSADFKFQFTGPSGWGSSVAYSYLTTAGAAAFGSVAATGAGVAAGTAGAGNKRVLTGQGIVTSSAAGTLQTQWAQNTVNAVTTYCHAGSYLALWQIQ